MSAPPTHPDTCGNGCRWCVEYETRGWDAGPQSSARWPVVAAVAGLLLAVATIVLAVTA